MSNRSAIIVMHIFAQRGLHSVQEYRVLVESCSLVVGTPLRIISSNLKRFCDAFIDDVGRETVINIAVNHMHCLAE